MEDVKLGMIQGVDEDLDEKETAGALNEVKSRRKAFAVWTVGNEDYRLKLNASMICKLEEKYNMNLLLLITGNGIPPISVMLTVIQAAMSNYHHGTSFLKVQEIYDRYVENGGDQTSLMTDVIMPLMGVSGFFTQNQMDIMTEEMKDIDSNL